MNKGLRILLVLIAVVSIGIAAYYPINYWLEEKSNASTLEQLTELRAAYRPEDAMIQLKALQSTASSSEEQVDESPEDAPGAKPPEFSEGIEDAEDSTIAGFLKDKAQTEQKDSAAAAVPDDAADSEQNPSAQVEGSTADAQSSEDGSADEQAENTEPAALAAPSSAAAVLPGRTVSPEGEVEASATPEPTPEPTPTPSPTINRYERTGALSYPEKEKVTLDMDKMLPEYKEIYKMNSDLVGWLTVPGLNLDAPVVQTDDSEFYLHHDFFGEENANGQIILDTDCDPYTPSYNLIISGHNMRSGKMFGNLSSYSSKSFWEKNKLLEFDTLMERKLYVVMAAFYSADYDTDEEGFRYNADIQYSIDLKSWLRDIEDNQIYDTGIDTVFGDEFLTLTTCNYQRKNGRFVIICRRVREGEEF